MQASTLYPVIFYPIEKGYIPSINNQTKTLFINAVYCPSWKEFIFPEQTIAIQPLKNYAKQINTQGYKVISDFTNHNCNIDEKNKQEEYDLVLAFLPKNTQEAQYIIAQSLLHLAPKGMFICAAENNAGGKRIKKWLKEIGIENVISESKNKAQIHCLIPDSFQKENLNQDKISFWLKQGDWQELSFSNTQHTFISKPGLFSWNKEDLGSKILLQNLMAEENSPDKNFTGKGADFGCGYGTLSYHILHKFPDIKELHLFDIDDRALKAAQKNLIGNNGGGNKDGDGDGDENGNRAKKEENIYFHWEDLTQPSKKAQKYNRYFDWIMMNPPFHQSKKTDIALGIECIKRASQCLKPLGRLYLVANAHLPYEEFLQSCFKKVYKNYEGQGFKVYTCETVAISNKSVER